MANGIPKSLQKQVSHRALALTLANVTPATPQSNEACELAR